VTQYYAIIGVILFCWLVFENHKGGEIRGGVEKGKMPGFVLIIFVAMTFVSGFRYRVGTDYISYKLIFTGYFEESVAFFFEVKEPGSFFLAKIASFFYKDYAAVFFLFALLTIYYSLRTIGRWANDICFGILLYMLLGSFHVSFNTVRQCLAVAIVFAGHRYIIDRKLIKYLLVCGVAMLFHVSAFFMVVPYFIATRKINGMQLLIFLGIIVVGWLSYEGMFGIAETLRDNPTIRTTRYSKRSINAIRVLVAWALVLVMYVLKGKRKWEDIPGMDETRLFFFNMLLFNAAIVTASMNSAYLARLFIYTNMYITIGLPLVVEMAPKKDRKWVVLIIIILFLGYWYTEAKDLRTFQWMWNRPSWE